MTEFSTVHDFITCGLSAAAVIEYYEQLEINEVFTDAEMDDQAYVDAHVLEGDASVEDVERLRLSDEEYLYVTGRS